MCACAGGRERGGILPTPSPVMRRRPLAPSLPSYVGQTGLGVLLSPVDKEDFKTSIQIKHTQVVRLKGKRKADCASTVKGNKTAALKY